MGLTVAAYQPRYYPRLHYLARAQQADVFVVYDDVEFSRRSRHHRAPIDHYGKDWLTVPVRHTGSETRLDEARIDMSEPWPAEHLRTLVGKYGAAAEELRWFYERLCAVVDPDYLRENADRIAARASGSISDGLIEECLQWDAEWRERRRSHGLAALREEKDRIAERINRRKGNDPTAAIDDLVSEATAIDDELADAETACREAKAERNRVLVRVSRALRADPAVACAPVDRLWDLEGIRPSEALADVRLVDLTIPILEWLFDRFGVTSTVVRSSEVAVAHPGDPSEYQARLTEHLGGDRYLSGAVGYEGYLDEGPFDERGVDVAVQDWSPPNGENVCALDVLFDAERPEAYIDQSAN